LPGADGDGNSDSGNGVGRGTVMLGWDGDVDKIMAIDGNRDKIVYHVIL